MATLADDIANVLRAHRVERIFGIPGGGSSLELIDAAARVGIPFVLARTEAAATIMAAATGELTGAPGAALVGVGPGASSAVNGVAYASLERSPMALFIDGPASSLHQHFDQPGVFAPLARGAAQIRPDGGAAALDELLSRAVTAPEGPVILELTSGDANAPATGYVAGTPARPTPAAEASLSTARDMLKAAKRPLLIVGLEARPHGDAVRRFADALGAAVMTTYKASGVYAAGQPAFIGPITGAAGEMPLMSEADLIVGVGFDPIEFIPGSWPENAPPVLILSEAAPDNPRVPVAWRVQGALAATLDALSPATPSATWTAADFQALKARIAAVYQRTGASFSCAAAVETMAACLDHGTRLTVDAGAHMFAVFGLWPATRPQGILKSNGLSSMGYALPAAIASKLTDPATPVVAVTGDGGLAMCLAELATAKELNLDITICVMNDAALSLIDIKQQRQQRPSLGVRYPAIDFAGIAKAIGWQAATVTNTDELRAALAVPGAKLIDIRVDPSGYGDDLARLRG